MKTSTKSYKVVVLGQDRVGKTSIIRKYLNGKFDLNQETTKQAYTSNITVKVRDELIQLSVWDTAGQEIFHGLAPIYYKDCDGAIVVFDITDRGSFERMQGWVKELKKQCGNTIHILVVGNKNDLEAQRRISKLEVEQYINSQANVQQIDCSAKSTEATRAVFRTMADSISNTAQRPFEIKKSNQPKVIILDDKLSVRQQLLAEILAKESWFWAKLDRSRLLQHWQGTRWQEDSSSPGCVNPHCGRKFGLFCWRHHCRNCGAIFCNSCTASRKPLPQVGYLSAVRVCTHCVRAITTPQSSPRHHAQLL